MLQHCVGWLGHVACTERERGGAIAELDCFFLFTSFAEMSQSMSSTSIYLSRPPSMRELMLWCGLSRLLSDQLPSFSPWMLAQTKHQLLLLLCKVCVNFTEISACVSTIKMVGFMPGTVFKDSKCSVPDLQNNVWSVLIGLQSQFFCIPVSHAAKGPSMSGSLLDGKPDAHWWSMWEFFLWPVIPCSQSFVLDMSHKWAFPEHAYKTSVVLQHWHRRASFLRCEIPYTVYLWTRPIRLPLYILDCTVRSSDPGSRYITVSLIAGHRLSQFQTCTRAQIHRSKVGFTLSSRFFWLPLNFNVAQDVQNSTSQSQSYRVEVGQRAFHHQHGNCELHNAWTRPPVLVCSLIVELSYRLLSLSPWWLTNDVKNECQYSQIVAQCMTWLCATILYLELGLYILRSTTIHSSFVLPFAWLSSYLDCLWYEYRSLFV